MLLNKIWGAGAVAGLVLGLAGTTISLPVQAESAQMRSFVRDLQAFLQTQDDSYEETKSTTAYPSVSANTNANAKMPHVGSFVLYSRDTPAARQAIAAFQKVVLPAYHQTLNLDAVFKRYAHCEQGTKGFVFRTYEKTGKSSVSFRCDLKLRQQHLRAVQRPEVAELLKETFYPFFAKGVAEETAESNISLSSSAAQKISSSFDAILKASMQPRTVTLEYEFYRSSVDPDEFPEYSAGIYVDYADNVSGYTDFVSGSDFAQLQEYVEFDELTALYGNKNLIDAVLESEPSHGLLLGVLLLTAYCDGL